MPPRHTSVRKVRTFADDIQRVRGEVPAPVVEIKVPKKNLASEVSEMMPHAVVKVPALPQTPVITPAIPLAQQSSEVDSELFNIRTSATAGEQSATIVSEHRAEEWSLTKAIGEAVRGWFGKTKTALTKGEEVPYIAPAADRIAVVRAASSESALAPQNDHDTLVEKLRSYTAIPPEEKTFVLPKPDEEVPRWSHIDQDGTVEVENPHMQRSLSSVVTTDESEPIVATIVVPQPLTPLSAPTPHTTAPTMVPHISPTPLEAPRIPPPHEIPPQESEPLNTAPEPVLSESIVSPVVPQKTFTELARERAEARQEFESTTRVTPKTTSHLPIYIGAVVLVLFVLVGIAGTGYFSLTRPSGTASVPQKASVVLKGITAREAVVLSNERTAFLIDLTKRTQAVTGALGELHEFYFVASNDTKDQELPPEVFFGALESHAPSALIRTVSSLIVGARVSSFNTPFMVLRVRDHNEALGGMLDWERYMNSDLAPFFGEDQIRLGMMPQKFTDTTILGNDSRVLKDQNNNTILAYSLVGNMVIISTNEDTLKALIQ